MKISFVIPAYNEEALIGACLQSIEDARARTPCIAEIIVVNNASTDRTKEIASQYHGVMVVDELHKGLTKARQAGFNASTGDIIANIDADTRIPPAWLPFLIATFAQQPHIVALSGPQIYTDLSKIQQSLVHFFYFLGYLLHLINSALGKGAMLQGGNFVVRRSALEAIGGFDTSIEFYGEDTDIAKRIARIGRVYWTFRFPIEASGRRLREEGLVRMSWKYTLNHLSILYRGIPFTSSHIDIRVQDKT